MDNHAGFVLYTGNIVATRQRINLLIQLLRNFIILSNHERAVLAHCLKCDGKMHALVYLSFIVIWNVPNLKHIST